MAETTQQLPPRNLRARMVLFVFLMEACALVAIWWSARSNGEDLLLGDWVWTLLPAGVLLIAILLLPYRVLFGKKLADQRASSRRDATTGVRGARYSARR